MVNKKDQSKAFEAKRSENLMDLERELQWFTQLLDTRLKLYFGQESEYTDIRELEPPELNDSDYGRLVQENHLGFEERVALMLALTPNLQPRLLDIFFTKNATFDRPFTEFGGWSHPEHPGFLPTGETLAFLLGGNDIDLHLKTLDLFDPDHTFARQHILSLESTTPGGPLLTGKLTLSNHYLLPLTTGKPFRPAFGSRFPAQLVETEQEWDDLVLPAHTMERIKEIQLWMAHGSALLNDWGMRRRLRPGYRCLFYGPPGTGKTMTASLLGKSVGKPVYKVDLSLVVSKYIGETEKNLARIFDLAEHKGWILFFDEADALFGKRTLIKDAHDRYANQEVSYLLQRIETFDGIVILASNQQDNLDEAFSRRFESMIYFPMPKAEQRLRIWRQSISPNARLAPDLDLHQIAHKYELTGGGIMNVVRLASLRAIGNGGTIHLPDVMEGIEREYGKEGRGV